MVLKISLLFLTLITMAFSKQETLTMSDGEFEGQVYSGNIENGKLNGQGKLYCKKIPDKVALDGNFVDNVFESGTLYSCNTNTFRNEIEFGNLENTKYKDESSTRLQYEINGDFKPKDENNPKMFNANLDITFSFFNTQFYDKLVGKTYIDRITFLDRDKMVDGTLYLSNNRIKEITSKFYISGLNFGGGKIIIKGDDFVLEGFTNKENDINDFYFDGVIKWNDNTEYYITDMRFKRDLIEKMENFKKLATPIKNTNSNKDLNPVSDLKNEVSISGGKNLNINTNSIEYTNNKVYKQNDNKTIDLERK